MSRLSALTLIAATVGMIATSTMAEAQRRGRVAGPNGAVTAAQGPNGGGAVRTRGARQNADGSVQRGSTGAVRTANGRAGRASTTTVNPDGSANRRSEASASGVRGSAATQGNVTRNADGSYSGGRTSTATSNTTGNSYNGSTQIDPATGRPVRNASCTDAAGNAIACPSPR
jgi:hypothetical protein